MADMILLPSQTSQPKNAMQPLSLYIHIPWCIRKCPYCDFNSHKSPEILPQASYVEALIADLDQDLEHVKARTVHSVFIGGGTPSLFAAESFARLFHELKKRLAFASQCEVTMEANPGTIEQGRFSDYRALGINRLSLGIQSFNPRHLKVLGRIHDGEAAHKAIETARKAGFDNLNLDLMHGLPNQTVQEGLHDLKTALGHQPEHLSWYQLTLEPNTVFYKKQPTLPNEEDSMALEEKGLTLLEQEGYQRYEISAFAKEHKRAQHNLNYWLFGDYLGIGAGAHGKHTTDRGILRTRKHRQPKEYLNPEKKFLAALEQVAPGDIIFEFMLNTTRLEQKIPLSLFTQTTGLPLQHLMPGLELAQHKQLIRLSDTHWQLTPLGRRFTNEVQQLFLP
jgi:oxygen-independent coproporphyrinogen-3 oxidase